jgi:hypothetical protein
MSTLWPLIALCLHQDPIVSGPQVGEKIVPFQVRLVLGEKAGKEAEFARASHQGPQLLIFVHEVNRQTVALTRVLANYAQSRAKDGVATGVVWLGDDVTETENNINRMKHALAEKAPTGISLDGREGPGSYGLNRKASLTILVANKNQVTANFPLVQPSLQADLPKVLAALVKEAGGKVPTLAEIEGNTEAMRPNQPARQDPNLRPLLSPVIRRDAQPEDVEKAAMAVEEYIRENAAARTEVGRIATTIVNSGKLENYGTAKAQEILRGWAKKYGAKPADPGTPGK